MTAATLTFEQAAALAAVDIFANVENALLVLAAEAGISLAQASADLDGLTFPVSLALGPDWHVAVLTKDGTPAGEALVRHVTEELGYRLLG